MATKRWILTDPHEPTPTGAWAIGPDDVGGVARGYGVSRRTLRGGLSEGVDLLRVSNGALRFDVLPTRGMGLWKAWLGELEIGWRSPVRGPVHPGFVPLMEPGGLGWLDGFDELLVRCGLESNGAPEHDADGRLRYPLHGRIGNRPAHHLSVEVDGEAGLISVTGVVEETRFHSLKARLTTTVSTRVGEPGLRIHDTVKNLSASPAGIQMLYHINFGQPLLEAGSRAVVPVRAVVPRTDWAARDVAAWDRYSGPVPGFEEQVYFLEPLGDGRGRTRALLHDARGQRGVSLHYDVGQLPCFTLWKNTTADEDGYVTGLEPGVNFPNPRSHEAGQGRVLHLEPGEEVHFDLGLEIHTDAAGVDAARRAVEALQAGVEPVVHDRPRSGWCALTGV